MSTCISEWSGDNSWCPLVTIINHSLSYFVVWSGRAVRSSCFMSLASLYRQEVKCTFILARRGSWLWLQMFKHLHSMSVLTVNAQDIMYPYGPAHRDIETPKMDDGSSPEISLTLQYVFFNVPYRSIYVSSSNINSSSIYYSSEVQQKFLNSIFPTYRSTTMVWSPSTCKSASLHLKHFHWATVGPSSLHCGLMCTTASVAMSITGNLTNQTYWRGQHKMSGSTLKTCPTSQLHGSLFQRGTKSPSTEEVKQPRYSCEQAQHPSALHTGRNHRMHFYMNNYTF